MKNWEHKDIKFKELIDYGFPLPTFTFTNQKSINVEVFDANGLKATNFYRLPPDLPLLYVNIWSLVPEINKKLNYSFD